MKKLIIDDAVPFAENIFSHLGEVTLVPGREITSETVKDADALIVRSRTQVNQSLLKNSSVEFVGSTVVGLDHIDQDYLASKNIHFYSAQGCNANSVSEYVISALLHFAEEHGFELSEKSLGIIGVGNVGKLLEQKAIALGMTVFLNDPPRQEKEDLPHFVDLDKALSADIISFHTPLTKDGKYPSHHLLNQNNFHLIHPSTVVINAARGGIIDESVWSKTETDINIIDCWENEPNIDANLYQKADIATPHIAGHALEAKIKGSSMVYEVLCQHWNQPIQSHWKAQVPHPTEPLTASYGDSFQSMLFKLVHHCYDPVIDDLAIRSNEIDEIHKKFEYYRRHYPTHHEWTEFTVKSNRPEVENNRLKALGFKVKLI
ncbi:4-phosphoerythronate dehydrogenase [Hydrogenovibrio marinus]|uniref:Erythronate-4-phosphate dehydrogenase n=1 Tax=Hydrogenovibrio marinus TaxID=28885 RepID=A0A066ZW06_HYDMR|nr:4-phosphoerythronate dehydrogenase [Hydrogenovibrio marinus]KDN96464.1 erythronate-4-phosphate dehydrogenase [Hydrogenovibrio marinus]BBN60340.1 erythronate-4-phosphate dehydrogenase [Hydrogenovibrio marinus]